MKLSHSEPLRWEKIGKVANWAKWPFQVILSNFGGKRLENCKSGEIVHSEPLQWEKIGKVVNRAKLATPESLSATLVGKDWKSCNSDKIQLFWGGGVHQPEPQCHVHPKLQLNLKNRGFLFSVFHKLEVYVCNEGGRVDW